MDLKKHSRREFIRLSGLSAAGVALAACARDPEIVERIVTETVVVEKEVAPPSSMFGESPMLAARVARGELPPVEERLPEEPLVIPVYERIGDYGGTITTATLRMEPVGWGEVRMIMGDHGGNWLRISRDATHAVPNFLGDWDVSDDFTEVTCYMRKGIRFSDGEPCTTEAIKFWYEDHLKNPEVTPVPSIWLRPGGELFELTILDDYTFKCTFAKPHPAFTLVSMAHFRHGSRLCATSLCEAIPHRP